MASGHHSGTSRLHHRTAGKDGQPGLAEITFTLRTIKIDGADHTSMVVSPYRSHVEKAPRTSSPPPQRTMSLDLMESPGVEQTPRRATAPQTTSEDRHVELAPSTSACFDDTDSAVLARLRRHACDISHLHFEDAAWTLPALGPYLSILNHISTLELDVNNAAEFVSNALKVVVPTVDELVLRFLKGPSWAKPIFSVIKERHPAVTVLELESPRTATLGSLTAARGKPTAASQEGLTDTGDKAKLPLRRVVGSINDLWVHGEHFKCVEVEIRSLVGWSEAREKLGKSLPFMQGTQCIKINLTSGESQALSDFILFLPMLYQNANFHTKASRIEIYLKGDRVMEFAHSISGFFKNVQCVIYKMLRPAGLFRSSLHYDSDHEKSNCSCEEATFIYQQVANGAEKWEAITKTGRNFRIKLEVSTSCLVSHSIEMKY